jgi:hypothetical protein
MGKHGEHHYLYARYKRHPIEGTVGGRLIYFCIELYMPNDELWDTYSSGDFDKDLELARADLKMTKDGQEDPTIREYQFLRDIPASKLFDIDFTRQICS